MRAAVTDMDSAGLFVCSSSVLFTLVWVVIESLVVLCMIKGDDQVEESAVVDVDGLEASTSSPAGVTLEPLATTNRSA